MNPITSYPGLREQVKQVLLLGRARIEQEKVRTYWETGRLIHTHILANNSRTAVYGKQVMIRLAKDLNIGETLLRRCSQFYQTFKKIPATWHESLPPLTWSHYRTLISIENPETREELVSRAVKQDWCARDLQAEVNKLKSVMRQGDAKPSLEPPTPLTPRKGTLYTYRLVRPEKIHTGKAALLLDLGFSSYREASMKGAENFKAADIVASQWVEADTYRLVKSPENTEAALFTYQAFIERVVDGDTLLVQVDLGFGLWTRQYLRLRGIDCPEMDTAEGKRAKKFVETELSAAPFVIISSTKSDKYDRYLADVFYTAKTGKKFLNKVLMEEGLAERM